MASAFHTPQRQGPRTPTYPWQGDSPTSLRTPQRASPHCFSGASTIRTFGTPASTTSASSPKGTPMHDRFVADRTAQDASLSRFLLTTHESHLTPLMSLRELGEAAGVVDGGDLVAASSSSSAAAVFPLASASERLASGGLGPTSPPRPPRSRDVWAGQQPPFGTPASTYASSDNDDDGGEGILHVASPLAAPSPTYSIAEPGSTSRRPASQAIATESDSSPTRHGVRAMFDSWYDGSRAGSLAGVAAASPRPVEAGEWSPIAPGRAVGRSLPAGRSPSASLPRGATPATTATTANSSFASPTVQPDLLTSVPSTTTATVSVASSVPAGAASSLFVEAEPYTCKLARALFTDAAQVSVLGLHASTNSSTSAAAAADQENNHDSGATGRLGTGVVDGARRVLDRDVRDGGGGRATTTPTAAREGERFRRSLGVVYEHNRVANFRSSSFRVIAQTPERILDAADMVDDFYLNLVDWSASNVLCVALQNAVYLWEAASCNITQLPLSRPSDTPSSLVCGVQWAPDGRHLGLGFNDGSVEVWDAETQQVVHMWKDHSLRVGSLSWAGGDTSVLASGSKDTTIRLRDLRERTAVSTLRCHRQEVCGLRWSPNSYHLASGGNDNQVLVWDRRWISAEHQSSSATSWASSPHHAGLWGSPAPRATPVLYLNQHTAAIKALAWNPVQTSLLATGGGTDDRTLRFWNTLTGDCLHSLDTGSQVCGVLWSHSGTELVSSHGFSMNQLSVWKYPSLRKVADLTGHTSRVLHLCLSADGEVVVSAAGDETIRFWKCFPPQPRPTAAAPVDDEGRRSRYVSPATSPGGKLAGGASPYDSYYGFTDSAAAAGSPDQAFAGAAARPYASPSHHGSPLNGSPRSGTRGQFAGESMFAADEVALR